MGRLVMHVSGKQVFIVNHTLHHILSFPSGLNWINMGWAGPGWAGPGWAGRGQELNGVTVSLVSALSGLPPSCLLFSDVSVHQ